MSYVEKGIKSKEVAILCYDKAIYDSCINRYYYSFYQNLMHKLECKDIYIDKKLSGGSHEKAFNTFIDRILRPIKRPSPREVTTLRTIYGDFKNLRKSADYNSTMITKKEVDRAIRLYNSLNNKINII
jgi:uncharacterized protein (UPF0332 family)